MKRFGGFLLIFFFTVAAFSQDVVRPKQPNLPGDLLFDYGFNVWSENPTQLPTRFWGSNSVGVYYMQRARFNDYLSLHYGVGFTFEKYAFEGDYTWINNAAGGINLDTLSGISPDKNKMVVNYLEVPLEFRIHPLSTVNGEGWFIGIGAVGGFRMGAHTKLRYQIGDNRIKEKLYDDFNINRFRYGLVFRFGFKTFHLFYKTYRMDLFTTAPDPSGIIPTTNTFGFNFSGF